MKYFPLSEIFSSFLSCHGELLLRDLRQEWVFGCKSQFEMIDDPVDERVVFDEIIQVK